MFSSITVLLWGKDGDSCSPCLAVGIVLFCVSIDELLFIQIEQNSWKGGVDDGQWLVQLGKLGQNQVSSSFFHLTCIVTYWKLWIIMKLRVPSPLIQSIWKCCIKSRPSYDHLPFAEVPRHLLWYPCIFVYQNFNVELFLSNSNARLTYMSSVYKTLWFWSSTVNETMHGSFSWGYNNA